MLIIETLIRKLVIGGGIIILLYCIIIATFIAWPNEVKSSAAVLENKFASVYKIGSDRHIVKSMLVKEGNYRFRTPENEKISVEIGSYPSANFFLIFPLATVVVLDLTFDDSNKLSAVKVWKYTDGP